MSEADPRDSELVRRARRELDRGVEELDEGTRLRLRAARLRALDALEGRSPFGARAALAAGVCVLAVALVSAWWLRRLPHGTAFGDGLEDVELLAAADDLELYDDLDFYRWLDDAESG